MATKSNVASTKSNVVDIVADVDGALGVKSDAMMHERTRTPPVAD